MRPIFGNAIRNVKEFFVQPVPDFGIGSRNQDTGTGGPLFDHVSLSPTAMRSQPSNQEVVLNALARASENYFLGNVAPLLRNVPNLRWQIKQLQIRETTDNMHMLAEINKLSPSILNTISKAVLCKLPCAYAMDMSQYYGLSIVPDSELVGRAVVMWANLGQEKTAMHFYFDDEIFECQEEAQTVSATGISATGYPGEAAQSFHLKLFDDNGARDISITKFPTIVGNSPQADVKVSGQYVSGQHLVLNWDAVLKCVYLTDRSKHGTFLKNGRKLVDGDRVNLLGDGSFKLTNQANAPRFEYWRGAAPGQGTALLPPEVRDAVPNFENNPAGNSEVPANPAHCATKVVQPTISSAKSSPAGLTHSGLPLSTSTGQVGAAQPTLLTEPAKPVPLAWLQVRDAKKHIETVAIATLPFSIGREFDGDGFRVDEPHVKVSRTHLRLLEQRGKGFGVSNESLQRPGQSNLTYGEKGAESHQFLWTPQTGNSNGGWRVLGSNRLDGECIEVRLLAPDSVQRCQP